MKEYSTVYLWAFMNKIKNYERGVYYMIKQLLIKNRYIIPIYITNYNILRDRINNDVDNDNVYLSNNFRFLQYVIVECHDYNLRKIYKMIQKMYKKNVNVNSNSNLRVSIIKPIDINNSDDIYLTGDVDKYNDLNFENLIMSNGSRNSSRNNNMNSNSNIYNCKLVKSNKLNEIMKHTAKNIQVNDTINSSKNHIILMIKKQKIDDFIKCLNDVDYLHDIYEKNKQNEFIKTEQVIDKNSTLILSGLVNNIINLNYDEFSELSKKIKIIELIYSSRNIYYNFKLKEFALIDNDN